MVGQVYKMDAKFHDPMDDEFIIMEELNNVVALMNNRTNNISWVSKHVLKLDFHLKQGEK